MKPISIIKKLNESEEVLPGVYQCNDCGKEFEKPGEGYTCPYCGSGDIIEPSFDNSLDSLGITNVGPLYYVNGTPEDCHTIEDADKYYASLPSGSSVNYSRDKGDITPEQYEFLDKHREETHKALCDFARQIVDAGPLD